MFTQLHGDFGHLSDEDREPLKVLLTSYVDVFALDSSELGTTQLVTHSINTGQNKPIKQPVRRMPFALRRKVEELIEEMLSQEVIELSGSPWASPIVLVQKKDGGVRFCVNYHRLNQITKLDEFPLPRIDNTLDLLTGSRYFSTLDLILADGHGPRLKRDNGVYVCRLLPVPKDAIWFSQRTSYVPTPCGGGFVRPSTTWVCCLPG